MKIDYNKTLSWRNWCVYLDFEFQIYYDQYNLYHEEWEVIPHTKMKEFYIQFPSFIIRITKGTTLPR